jgi:molybdopterin converting factor subunit 1
MKIRVLFFASYRELLGRGEEHFTLPEGSKVSDLLQTMWEAGEPFSHLPGAPVVAVNRAFASPDTSLENGDEVALVPPVAGG